MSGFKKGAAWIRGNIVPIDQAFIGVTDWAVTHSDVVYDVVPVWNGAFFRLPDYLDRFDTSMQAGRFDIDMSRAAIITALTRMVARSTLQNAYVAMVAARGTPLIPGTRDPRTCANHFYAWCVPYVHVVAPDLAEAGVSVWLSGTTRRIPPDSINPRAKNYHWGDFTAGLFEAKDNGFETVLLPDHAGNVTEGPGFNVFALKDGCVTTPHDGVLHGITRRTVLELCLSEGFKIQEKPLPVSDLMEADEVFLSTSGGGIIPVARINDRLFGNNAAGPAARHLRTRYFETMTDPNYRTPIPYT